MTSKSKSLSPLVSVSWLSKRLQSQSESSKTTTQTVCLDASWFLPNSPFSIENYGHGCTSAYEAWTKKRLPNSAFFHLDECVKRSQLGSDSDSGLPHMMPSKQIFEKYMTELKITNEDTLICYDKVGVFSAPRMWYTLRYFGHYNSFVLNGGLPAWEQQQGEIVTTAPHWNDLKDDMHGRGGPIDWREDKGLPYFVPPSYPVQNDIVDADFVSSNAEKPSDSNRIQHYDVRPPGRFDGTAPEPRPGLRSGHVPNSINLPFGLLLEEVKANNSGNQQQPQTQSQSQSYTMMKPPEDLEIIFKEKNLQIVTNIESYSESDNSEMIVSCGSGMTANILTLATEVVKSSKGLGSGEGPLKGIRLYDGSWSDYGDGEKHPEKKVETNKQTRDGEKHPEKKVATNK